MKDRYLSYDRPGNSLGMLQPLVLTLATIIGFVIGAPAAPAGAAGDHACDYLSKEQVATVIGAPVGEIERHDANPMGQSVCFFDIPAGTAMRFAQLQMVRTDWAARAGTNWDAPSLFANNMSFLGELTELSGIGETAY